MAKEFPAASVERKEPVAQKSAQSLRKPKNSKISAELRQAVKDLGGDDEDLDLIDGVDEDEEVPQVSSKVKGNLSDEKALKRALGGFMKGLNFSAVAPDATSADVAGRIGGTSESEENAEDETEEDDEKDGEGEDEDEEDGQDEDESGSDQTDDKGRHAVTGKTEADVPQPSKKNAPPAMASTAKTVKSVRTAQDEQSSSGTNVPATPAWSNLVPDLPTPLTPLAPVLASKLAPLRSRGQNLLDNLPALPRASSSSDAAFISQILQSGTHQDKLSALVLLVRESPIHAVRELSRLRAMAGWKEDGMVGGGNKDQRLAVVKALADWWVTRGGKEKGKLRYFADQPLLAHPGITDRHLLVFAFEDYMKRWFFNTLQVLEVLSHDTLPYIRTQALHIVFQLLSGNAEQEQNLLRLGINKLGDTDRSVASKASHHTLTLLSVHPAMKAVVAREVSTLVLKPASTSSQPTESGSHIRFDGGKAKRAAQPKVETTGHARYYGLITLNQMTLTTKDKEVAGRMVDLYFEVFREIWGNGMQVNHGDEPDEGEEVDQEKVEKVAGRVDRWRGRRKGAQPRGGKKTALESEELVETGDSKLVAAVLTGINRALPFAKLDEEALNSYMDILFKITHAGTFNTSIQALNLIFQVSQAQQAASDRFHRTLYDSLFDGRLITSSKQAMYLNLLFKALKADPSVARVMAFVKRLLQMLGMYQPPFICGALYLLGELFVVTPGLKRMLIEPEDDGDEHFVDTPETAQPSQLGESSKAARSKEYDGRKREPQYANADSSCLWELVRSHPPYLDSADSQQIPFLYHFHPSVSLQASQLLLSQPLTGSPDISLNSLVSFLDRFVYRNPKKNLQPKGASIMQPAAAGDVSGMIVKNNGARTAEDSFVNSEKFWRKKIADVPVDQLFFHKFFSTKLAQKEAARKKKGNVDDSEEEEEAEDREESEAGAASPSATEQEVESEEDSDPGEAEIWKAMKATMPAVGDEMGLGEDGSDSDEADEDDGGDESTEKIEDEDIDVEAGTTDGDEDTTEEEIIGAPPIPSKGKGKGKESTDDETASESDTEFPNFDDEDEDVLPSDEMPDIGLDAESEGEEEDTVESGKRKRNAERKEKRKKRKELPTFGRYEDYRALIEAGGSEGDD